MINLADYISTGEAIEEWLTQDKRWQCLADWSHDGNLCEAKQQKARRLRNRRRDKLRARVYAAVVDRRLPVFLLPVLRTQLGDEGPKLRKVVEYLISNPSKQFLPSKTIAQDIQSAIDLPSRDFNIDRKTVDRAKEVFDELERWRACSAWEPSDCYFDTLQFAGALYSGDARKLTLTANDANFCDGVLYFRRGDWLHWKGINAP